MSAKRRLSLDTDILVYALDQDAAEKHDVALEIVDRAVMQDTVLTMQALCEFYAAVTRKHKMPPLEAEAQVEDWFELFPVVTAKPTTLVRAMRTSRKHSLSFWDAMLWATATEANVTILISEDFQHDRMLDGVRICNPFEVSDPMKQIFAHSTS